MANDSDPAYVLACAGAFLAICPVMVMLRFYTRAKQQNAYGPDDWLTLPALLMVAGSAITLIVGVHDKAFGYPTPKVDPGNAAFRRNEQLEWAFFLMLILAMGCIKLSFVFFFRRIFCVGKHSPAFSIASVVIAIIVFLWTIAFLLWFLFSCPTNFAGRWTSTAVYHASCPTDGMSDNALAISDVITDVMIFVLPIPMVLRLNMSLTRKLIVLGVFVLGSMSLVASSIRLAYFVYAIQVSEGEINDPTLDNNLLVTRGLYWSMLETGIALTCCCLPTLNAFVRLPGVQSAVASARSVFSLESRGSRSRNRDHRNQDPEWNYHKTAESQRELSSAANTDIALETLHNRETAPPVPESGIRVEHSIVQTSTRGLAA